MLFALYKKSDKWMYAIAAGLFLGYLWWVISANLAANSPLFLDVDEWRVYESLQKIYRASSLPQLLKSLVSNSMPMYGSLFINVAAVFSYIPYLLFGSEGQISATRILQAGLLFSAYGILIWTFVKNHLLRIVAFFTLLLLPMTPYYATSAKPDPLQLLFISLFFVVFKQSQLYSLWAWIWLGLSVGTKITMLPFTLFCLMLYTIGIIRDPKSFNLETKPQDLMRVVSEKLAIILFWLSTMFIIAVPKILIDGLLPYMRMIAGASRHGYDTPFSQSVIYWLQFILNDYMLTPAPIVLLQIIGLLLAIVYLGKDPFYVRISATKKILTKDMLLIFAAFSLLLPVILFGKFVTWHYLHLPSVLLVICVFLAFEKVLVNYRGKIFAKVTVGLFALALLPFLIFQLFGRNPNNQILKNLENSVGYTNTIELSPLWPINKQRPYIHRPLTVIYNADLYQSISIYDKYRVHQIQDKILRTGGGGGKSAWEAAKAFLEQEKQKNPEQIFVVWHPMQFPYLQPDVRWETPAYKVTTYTNYVLKGDIESTDYWIFPSDYLPEKVFDKYYPHLMGGDRALEEGFKAFQQAIAADGQTDPTFERVIIENAPDLYIYRRISQPKG